MIPTLCKWFSDTAVPDVFFSDQGPPYSSTDFQDFLKRWGVAYQCSSAEYPQGNSLAELAVKNCKSLLDKYYCGSRTDWESFDKGVLQIRNTPHKSNNLSPAMLLYGRPVQDAIPAHKSLFTTDWHERFADADRKFSDNRTRLETAYNRGTRDLPPLRVGTPIAVQDPRSNRWDRYGVVQEVHHRLRRYVIRLASGMIITRNRRVIRQRINPTTLMPPIRTLNITPTTTTSVPTTAMSGPTATTSDPVSNDPMSSRPMATDPMSNGPSHRPQRQRRPPRRYSPTR